MTLLLPTWTEERTEQTARGLGLPPGSEWAFIWQTDRPISRREPWSTVFIKLASQPAGTASRFTLPFKELKPLEGFFFQLFGRVADEPITDYWQLEPTPGRDEPLKIEKWWMGVQVGASMVAQLRYDPASGEARKLIEILSPTWEQDANYFTRAVKSLDMVIAVGRPPGSNPDPVPGFVEEAIGTYWDLTDYDGERPSDARVADRMALHPTRFSRLKRLYFIEKGVPWPPMSRQK